MRRRLFGIITLLVFVGTATATAFGWGADGHRAIGEFARTRLNAHARREVVALLGNDDLATAATWADELKSARRHKGRLKNDAEAEAFNLRFKDNATWHYMDLPLATRGYSPGAFGVGKNDPVAIMQRCVTLLRSPRAVADRMTRKQALLWLVHLAGDIHQPFHVGSGYYTVDKDVPLLVKDPSTIQEQHLLSDRGGNALRYQPRGDMHQRWDTALVHQIGRGYRNVVREMKNQPWHPGTDCQSWPAAWASECLAVANQAFTGLTFQSATTNGRHELVIDTQVAPRYDDFNRPRALEQLSRAGSRLAALLNAIWP